jgi:hypothetical protein
MVLNLSKGSQYAASNHRMLTNSTQVEFKKEDKIHQQIEDIDLGNYDSLLSIIRLEEANIRHVFH